VQSNEYGRFRNNPQYVAQDNWFFFVDDAVVEPNKSDNNITSPGYLIHRRIFARPDIINLGNGHDRSGKGSKINEMVEELVRKFLGRVLLGVTSRGELFSFVDMLKGQHVVIPN